MIAINEDAQTTAVSIFDPSKTRPKPDDKNAPEPLVENFAPPFPQKLDELGVGEGFLCDLALKTLSLDPDSTTAGIAARMHIGLVIADGLMQKLCGEKLVEKRGVVGLHNHRYAMLDRGWFTYNQIMPVCSYIGPAPVSLESYTQLITRQVRSRSPVTHHALDRAMINLVLSAGARQTLGLVASSGRSLFLSGPSGNGKTAMARALVNAIPDDLWIPHAIEVDGQVIRVFDQHMHHAAETAEEDVDRRWVKIRPPLVVVGGELTLDSMELVATNTQRFYEAPFQMKSNGGVLVVDDLGRQRCSATELLNRWIVPLENRVDYLTLRTGKKIEVPFEQIVIFATNLTVSDLADEAFLRRMGYRLYVLEPGPETYAEIFRRCARSRGLATDANVLEHLEKRYGIERRCAKACEPRDLIDRAVEICKYRREPIRLTKETLDTAWDGYFGAAASG
jgi:hypothetical protein